jgi:2-dehydropantoate 2-reductase
MRIAVMGTGALGGYYGGLLARAGEEVTCIARGAHLEAIRNNGLTVRSSRHGEFAVSPAATSDPAAVGPVDLVLFCVKAYDLEPAAEAIRPMVGPETMVLPVQNGIDIAERLERVVGPGHVLGGAAFASGFVESPGVVVHTVSGPNELVLGELEGGNSPRAEQLAEVLRRSGITVLLSPAIRVALWEKFGLICSGTITTLTHLPTRALMQYPETRELYRGVMEEAVAVARAHGVVLREEYVDDVFRLFDSYDYSHRQSMYYDLAAGRRIELDTLNGTLVRLGREAGVPTPLNFAIWAALKPYVDGAPKLP